MLCRKCGSDMKENAKFCEFCGAPVEAVPTAEDFILSNENTPEPPSADATVAMKETAVETSAEMVRDIIPEKPAKSKKGIFIVIGAVAALVIAALVAMTVFAKKPKDIVIDAFKSVNDEKQVSPMEELFGFGQFAENMQKENNEMDLVLKMDASSVPEVNAYAGSGFGMKTRSDIANNKAAVDMTAILGGMDLLSLNLYADQQNLMAAVPELSDKVFAMTIDENLAEQLKNSPVVGPALAEQGIDVDGLISYIETLTQQMKSENTEGTENPYQSMTWDMLVKRYQDGCKAKEEFEAAMTVKKGNTGSYTMNGKLEKCKGYDVVISKDSMITFLRDSSEFFLQDEELKEAYLQQMEMAVEINRIMGNTGADELNSSAADLLTQNYEEVQKSVDEMIAYLDKSLHDVEMKVYVDKKGQLAAVDGTTVITVDGNDVDVSFHMELQGGTYLTQNMLGRIELKKDQDMTVTVNYQQTGTYDKEKLTHECTLNASVSPASQSIGITYSGDYTVDSGEYHMNLGVKYNYIEMASASVTGVVDDLEKGKWIHTQIDEIKIGMLTMPELVTLSGEFGIQPLSGEITPPTGETMDVLAATPEEFSLVGLEMMIKGEAILRELGVY